MRTSTTYRKTLPLVGRERELARMRAALDRTEAGTGRALLIRGDGGVGKSRLIETVLDEGRRRGWTVATGRAYPVETGAPYALFSDAFLPLLRGFDEAALTVLTRGAASELQALFPALALGRTGSERGSGGGPAELKTRLFWSFVEFLHGLAARGPLLIALEDLHWADESSLELLHFVARQNPGQQIQFVVTSNDAYREDNHALTVTEQSLVGMELLDVLHLGALSLPETAELLYQAFGADRQITREFAALLHGWTRGNPFFMEETLAGLIESGRLWNQDGTWLGWEVEALELPPSVREVVLTRMGRLPKAATEVSNIAAVLGNRVSYRLLRSTVSLSEADLLEGIDELRRRRVFIESEDGDAVNYDFTHPLVRETLYAELGKARSRVLHGVVAEALERYYGDSALEHPDELAFHFARADVLAMGERAVRYLAAAGRSALARFAYQESAGHLRAARDRLAALPPADGERLRRELGSLEEDLAWATQALGNDREALELLGGEARRAREASDLPRELRVTRKLAHIHFWNGRYPETLELVERGLSLCSGSETGLQEAALMLVRGLALEQMGRPAEARETLEVALELAKALGDPGLLAKTHRALALVHLLTGNPEGVLEHGETAVGLAIEAGSRSVEFWSYWLLAVFQGLTGDAVGLPALIERARKVAVDIHSPHLRLWAAELMIEHASATGEWERGIALGEQAATLSRSLGQSSLLPRLLVWTGFMHLGRGELERARELMDEAWERSGAGRSGPLDVHTVVPAHTGRAAYHLALGEYDRAIEIGMAGVEIADRSGYFIWGIHRLLPTVAEAYLLKRDLAGALQVASRMRRDSERIGHRLGIAWADACEALVTWLSGDSVKGRIGLESAARALEAIPFVWDAARVRRQLAGRLADAGETEEALVQLRSVHETFLRIGAEAELDKTRDMFREIGSRPPARSAQEGVGAGALTSREVEIAHMVAERKSNKAIAKVLDISPRTVSTHVSNIYKKVGVSSRGELTDLVRSSLLPER